MTATFVWFHNHSEKPADSTKFYTELLGWKPADGPPGMTMLAADAAPFAGAQCARGTPDPVTYSAPGESRHMTYDEKLVDRIRRVIPQTGDITERKMFGGVAFIQDGKMFVGVASNDLMVRVGPEAYEAALARPHVRLMDFTGRPLTGYVYVGAVGTRTDAAVAAWVVQAIRFVSTLPKTTKKRRPRRLRPRPKRKAKPSRS